MSTASARARARAGLESRARVLSRARTFVALASLILVARAVARVERALSSGATRALHVVSLLEVVCGVLGWTRVVRALERATDAAEERARGARERDVELQTTHASEAGGIWLAVKSGNVDKVKTIAIASGASALRERGPVGETPTHLMVLYGGGSSMADSAQLRAAKYVGEKYPWTLNDVYIGEEYVGESALHIAVVNKNEELVAWLLKTTTNAKGLLAARAVGRFFSRGAPCYYGEYALSFAASTGQCKLVDALVRAGADLTAQDTHGNTCLHMCVMHNQPETYEQLCRLWSASVKNSSSEHALERMANADGLTPLLFAARNGYTEMFEFLLERSCVTEWSYGPVTCKRMPLFDVDTRPGKRVNTCALSEIVENGHEELLELPLIQELVQRKWDCYLSKMYHERVWQAIVFVIAMTLVHVTSFDIKATDWCANCLQTVKTAVVLVGLYQLSREWGQANLSGQNLVSAMYCGTYVASHMTRAVFDDDFHADALLAISFLLAWFYIGCLLMGFRGVGHFIIMIYEIVVNDVFKFGIILGLFLVAFSTAVYVVVQPVTERSFSDFQAQLLKSFAWLADGGFQEDVVDGVERGKSLVILLLASFTILGAIVLLNLLVAMMGDTYAKVSENAVAKWRLERARIALALERSVPPGRRDRLDSQVSIQLHGERFLQVQLVNGALE